MGILFMTLQDWHEQDRQWLPHCRIAHAEYRLKQSKDEAERKMWRAVIEANTTHINKPSRSHEHVHNP
jgi:hypothetical protein